MIDYFDAGGGLVWGMRQEPDNFQVLGAVQGVSQQVNLVNEEIRDGMDEVLRKMDAASRKKRKCLVSSQMATTQSGEIALITTYDDSSMEAEPFLLNIRGNWEVYRVALLEREESPFFGIYFPVCSWSIIGRREKVKGDYLYDTFLRAGATFNPNIKRSVIAQKLNEAFVASIELTEKVLTISTLAGWDSGCFRAAQNFAFAKVREFSDFPILKQNFRNVEFTERCWKEYFRELNKIVRWEDRLMIMLFPFASILKSILKEEKCCVRISLNFVRIDDFPTEKICSWIKVFNRERLSPVNPWTSEGQWNKLLASSKDDALVVDFTYPENGTPYEKKKLRMRWRKTLDIVEGKIGLPGTDSNSTGMMLATISDRLYFRSGVYNVLLDDGAYEKKTEEAAFLDMRSMDGVLNAFVNYVQNHMEEVRKKIRIEKKDQKEAWEMWAVMRIIEAFWEQENLTFWMEAHLPKRVSFKHILEENCMEEDGMQEKFVRIVRKEFCKWKIFRKERAMTSDGILYDDEFLYFKPETLEEMLDKNGLKQQDLTIVLLDLKEGGYMKNDDGRLGKKVQINNTRRTWYVIRREVFNSVGTVDIINLKEE